MLKNMKKINKILLEVNQICNLKCSYCFYNDYGRNTRNITLNDVETIIDNYPYLNTVYITGGEPYINPQIFDIVNYLKYKNKNVSIFSNGAFLEKLNEDKLKEHLRNIKKIIITFDSFSSDYNLRGDNKKTLETIKKIVNIDPTKLCVKICINKINAAEFEMTLNKLSDIRVRFFSINLIHNIKSSNVSFEISKSQLRKILDYAYKYDGFDTKYIKTLNEYFFMIKIINYMKNV